MINTRLSFWIVVLLVAALFRVEKARAFLVSPSTRCASTSRLHPTPTSQVALSHCILKSTNDDSTENEETKKSLEEKMAGWEASEEEIKASTLGGVTPPQRSDAFDIGLYIAFPFMILASLAFAFFPFIMDKIDVSSVGPPPIV